VRLEAAFALRTVEVDSLEPAAKVTVEGAFSEWLRAQSVMGELPESHFNAGVFWTARGRLDEAERAYRTAIARWPRDLAPRQNLAMVLLAGGRPADAEAEFKAALGEAPAWPPALCGLGQLYAAEKRLEDAIRSYEECVSHAPQDPGRAEALRELVRIAYQAGDRAVVERWLPQALLADPTTAGHPGVRAALGLNQGEGRNQSEP
jgi:tetratricopeptide (TPR) repeat protein